jgi:hypothetical protein
MASVNEDEDEDEDAVPRYKASLRVRSETLSAAEISRRLGDPDRSRERGELKMPERYPDGPRFSHSQWNRESRVGEGERLDAHIGALLDFVDAHRDAIDGLRDSCEMDIFCGVFSNDSINCHYVLESELLKRLGDLGLSLFMDNY